MAIRVVARIRPQQPSELEKDVIVSAAGNESSDQPTLVKIPNPKNEGEDFTFQFSSVYNHAATQQQIFDNEGKRARSNRERIGNGVDPLQYRLQSSTYSVDSMSQYLRMAVQARERLIQCEAGRAWQSGELFRVCCQESIEGLGKSTKTLVGRR